LATATVAFQRRYDFDFVKVTPASSFCLRGWGVVDHWVGALEGTRSYEVHPVQTPDDWRKLQLLSPHEGALGAQLQCLRLLSNSLQGEVPYIQTVFSPLSQAKNLAGQERLLVHLRHYPDAVHAGLATITETTRRFLAAAAETGIDGVFYAVQHAQYGLLSEGEYAVFGCPYDAQILEVAQGLWLNVLHLHGADVMFDLLADYPVQVINWHDREAPPTLAEGQERFAGAVCGGLQRWETVVRGTPEQVTEQARDALAQTGGRRFILGTGCVTPVVAPTSNIHAAREAVEARGLPRVSSALA
jgi:uroporphyrinogen decarboxylase